MGDLWRSTDTQHGTGDAAAWVRAADRAFAECLLDSDPPYPFCGGQIDGESWCTAVEPASSGARGVAALAETLLAFQGQAGDEPQPRTLVVFVGPPDPAPVLARHTDQFWRLLGHLAARDPQPWPHDRTRDVLDPAWQWCFAGEPWFVFGASPAHRSCDDRDRGPCLTVLFRALRAVEGSERPSMAGEAPWPRERVRRLAPA